MILDYFGIIGGFNAALNLLFGRFCRFFSGNFLQAAVAEDLFVRKRSKQEVSTKYRAKKMKQGSSLLLEGGKSSDSNIMRQNIKNLFGKFKFTPWQLFKDAIVINWLSSLQCCIKFKAFDRKKIIDEANKRFKGELDIIKILKKIRNANDMLETLMTAQDRNIIKINK
mgnify:FL=1